jgi:hypothetical protein
VRGMTIDEDRSPVDGLASDSFCRTQALAFCRSRSVQFKLPYIPLSYPLYRLKHDHTRTGPSLPTQTWSHAHRTDDIRDHLASKQSAHNTRRERIYKRMRMFCAAWQRCIFSVFRRLLTVKP